MALGKMSFRKIKNNLRWRLLDTYILKKYLGSFFFSIAMLMTIIIVFDVSDNIQRFIDYNVPFAQIVWGYYFNFIPYFINLFTPLFTFISVIWFTSQLSQRNEIVAILSGGVNYYRLMVPYITGAILIAILSFLMSNFVIPYSNSNLNRFKQQYFHRRTVATTDIHIKNSSNSYIYVGRWEKMDMKGFQFTYEELDRDVTTYKISANTFQYDPETERWTLEDYIKRTIKDSHEIVTKGMEMDTVFDISPVDLNKDATVVETMTYQTLEKYIREEKEKGTGFSKYYIMEKHKRMANSLGTIIMTLLGLSVASRKTNRGIGVHLFVGMGMAFSFIFLQQVSDVFAVSGGLPAALGAWMPDLIFLIACIILLRLTPK